MYKNEEVFKAIWGAPFVIVSGIFPTTKNDWVELLKNKIDIETRIRGTNGDTVKSGNIKIDLDEMLSKVRFHETKGIDYFFKLSPANFGIKAGDNRPSKDFHQLLLDLGFEYCNNDDVLKIVATKGRELKAINFGVNRLLTRELCFVNGKDCNLTLRPTDLYGPNIGVSPKGLTLVYSDDYLVKMKAEKLKEVLSQGFIF